jgi:hypothetical protein
MPFQAELCERKESPTMDIEGGKRERVELTSNGSWARATTGW